MAASYYEHTRSVALSSILQAYFFTVILLVAQPFLINATITWVDSARYPIVKMPHLVL